MYQKLISDFFFEAIDDDVEPFYLRLLSLFVCLFTPLSIKTSMTPTLLGEAFGTKKIFGAIGLKC